MKEQPSNIGLKKCVEWLLYCLKIGYKKDQLNDLEKLFWKFKDRDGNLINSKP